MSTYTNQLAQRELRRISDVRAKEAETATRHKCFLAHHGEDAEEVLTFVQDFASAMIPRSIGVEDDEFIDSDDDDYVMGRIRQKYLGATTVTIVMLGACTWARKYVDWEIYSSLRSSSTSTRNGLMSIRLPSGAGASYPERLSVNRGTDSDEGYARAWKYPSSAAGLQTCIEDAFTARTSRAHLIKPAAARWKRNRTCP